MASLEDCVPENALLSHDLFEGLHAPRGAGLGRGIRGRIPVERAGARPAAAPLDPRRLADPVLAVPIRAVAPRHQAQHAAAHRALEDSRQPSPQPRRADAARDAGRGVDGPAGPALVLDDDGADGHRLAAAAARRAAAGRAAAGAVVCGVLAQPARRRGYLAGPGRARPDLPRQQRVGNGPRDRADAGAAGRHAAAPARVGDGRAATARASRARRPQRRAATSPWR